MLKRPDKGVVRAFWSELTGFSQARLTRLIRQYRETGTIRDRRGEGLRQRFGRVYTKAAVGLLAEVDTTLGHLCGHAARAVMRRQHEEYDEQRFERLASPTATSRTCAGRPPV